MTLDANDAPRVVEALSRESILAYDIGRVTPAESGLKLATGDGVEELPSFERDELARFFGRP